MPPCVTLTLSPTTALVTLASLGFRATPRPAPAADSLDAADYHLGEGVDQGLEGFAGADGAERTAPQVQAVHKLPVVHGLVRFLGRVKSISRSAQGSWKGPALPHLPCAQDPSQQQHCAHLPNPTPRPQSCPHPPPTAKTPTGKDPDPTKMLGCLSQETEASRRPRALGWVRLGPPPTPQAQPHTFLRVVMALRRWMASWRI